MIKNYLKEIEKLKSDISNEHTYRKPLENLLNSLKVKLYPQSAITIQQETSINISDDSDLIIKWLKECGASKAVIHFDLDVLEPKELIAAVGVVENGMKIKEVVRVINDIAKEKEIVGLTIAEHMPRVEIMMKNILDKLPLMK